ncbi:MAG: hypothetical protein PHG69_01005 [Candidatus Omnitrophica bacterium]|nr:hypothetical protein [Candidatus Omnitrophota bacterium]
MKRITLITMVVFIGVFIVTGYCFAGWEESFEGSTQAPEGKVYTHIEKTSEKSIGLFQPLTDFIVKTEANRVMAYSGDAILNPDAITGSVKSIEHGDDDNGSNGNDNEGTGGGVPEELDDNNVIEAGAPTGHDMDMTAAEAELGGNMASEIISIEKDLSSEGKNDSGLEGTIEKIDVNSGAQLGVK